MTPLEQRVAALEQAVVRYGSLTAPGGGTVAAARLRVGGGAMVQQVSKYQFNLNAISVPASGVFVSTVTIPGLALNDWVLVVPPDISNAPMCTAFVFAPNTLRLGLVNPTTLAQNSPAGIYTVIAIRS